MSCCGQSRAWPGPARGALPATPAAAPVSTTPGRRLRVVFEYLGATALTVVGPVSRQRYHFPASGARVTIDPRDRPGIARVPKLRQVP